MNHAKIGFSNHLGVPTGMKAEALSTSLATSRFPSSDGRWSGARRSGGVPECERGRLIAHAKLHQALAFSRGGDPATGEFGDAKLIRKLEDVSDPSAL
ncbi:hypothetical protein ACVWWK_002612 [Bradyrhizobium sp. LB9.1b]